jgi:hypothetical protein
VTKPGITALLRELCKRPQGVTTDDPAFGGVAFETIGNAITKLVRRGEIFRAKVSHKNVRYFNTADRAKAFLERASAAKQIIINPARSRMPPGWDEAQPTRTDKTIFTVCKPWQPRYREIETPGLPQTFGGLQRGRVFAKKED